MLTIADSIIYVTVFFGIFTSIFFLITLLKPPRKKPKQPKEWPTVCIVVPCYNEQDTVAGTLDSLLKIDYPKQKLEIMVVDDGSTDKTYAIAKQYEKHGVHVFRKKNGGKYTALNFAIQRTNAAYIGALDADSFVDSQALKRIVAYFDRSKVMAVTPSMKVYQPKNWLQQVQWTEYLIGIFLRKAFAFLGSIHVTPGPFSIYRREFFLKHGLYKHAHNTEDIEVALRIQKHNYEIENANDAYVYTITPNKFKQLWNQRLRWYYGFVRNTEDYKTLFSFKHGILGTFILPSAFLSIFLVIIGLVYIIYRSIANTVDQYIYLRATGYHFFQWNWNFDPFYININSVAILGIIAMIMSVLVILTAKKIANEKQSILKPYIWFLLIYWWLYGIWWIATIYCRISGKKLTWKHKSEA